jgi:hypothetical protein
MRDVLAAACGRSAVLPEGATAGVERSTGREGRDVREGCCAAAVDRCTVSEISCLKGHAAPDLQPGTIGENNKSVSISTVHAAARRKMRYGGGRLSDPNPHGSDK